MKLNTPLQFLSLLITSTCVMVMAMTLLFSQNMNKLISVWSEDIHVNVYLSESLSPEEQMGAEAKILKLPGVASFAVIPQQKAVELLETQLAGVAGSLSADAELLKLIPTTYSLGLDPRMNIDQRIFEAKKISGVISEWPEVQDVSFGQEWLQNFLSFSNVTKTIFNFLSILVAFACILIISNSIRANIENKRAEIEILELVGATNRMIQRPFVKEGALLGLTAGFCGLGLAFLFYIFLRERFLSSPIFNGLQQQVEFLEPGALILLLILSAILGSLGSYVCVRKINTGWAAAHR